ncbi:MAG TPA: alpha/beta hydrolase [Kofleriaceae bacterium]|nr:alpha/beta hydrolase [Kofleriaceae bacterium]
MARLHHAKVGDQATGWLLMLHGIYGSGGNWRTFARRLNQRRPEWGCVLVDLRMHGRSRDLPPPHTLAAAAVDVAELATEVGARAIAGHSFGGKVALAALAAGSRFERTWVLDASPSARPGALVEAGNSVAAVLAALEALPAQLVSRDDFAARLRGAGIDPAVVAWLGMNLEPAGGGFTLRLDLAAMRALLADYYATDLWPVVEHPPGPLRFAVAGRGSALSPADRARLQAATANPLVQVHDLPDAGHWLNVDALDALVDLLASDLP